MLAAAKYSLLQPAIKSIAADTDNTERLRSPVVYAPINYCWHYDAPLFNIGISKYIQVNSQPYYKKAGKHNKKSTNVKNKSFFIK
jgi:hypothetical protein